MSDFWDRVNAELDVPCKPVTWQEWTERALASMNQVGNTHPLWPVQHFLGQLGLPRDFATLANAGTHECLQSQLAVHSNVQYMKKIGFIHSSVEGLGNVQREGTIRRVHALGG